MDATGTHVATATGLPDGSTLVSRHASDSGSQFAVSYTEEIEVIAIHGSWTALGMPDYDSERGLVAVYQGDQLVDAVAGAEPGDRFGAALAMTDVLLVVGAPEHGANGAAYLLVCCDAVGGWVDWQTLDSPATSQTGAEFGAAVDITGDGDWIAVGSPRVDRTIIPLGLVDVGAVYLFEHVGLTWQLDGFRRPAGAADGDHFGASVAIQDEFLVAGSPGEDGASSDEGAAYVYHLAGTEWESTPRLRLADSAAGEDDALGSSVAAGDPGVLVGTPRFDHEGVLNTGAVLFFRHAGAFFDDGFESGDTSAWSLTAP
jgi:hypothetical protein